MVVVLVSGVCCCFGAVMGCGVQVGSSSCWATDRIDESAVRRAPTGDGWREASVGLVGDASVCLSVSCLYQVNHLEPLARTSTRIGVGSNATIGSFRSR